MDATKEQKVKDTVNDLMKKGFMFTAYDITKTIRHSGEYVKHGDVNNVIQAMFKNSELGQYTREVVDVGAPVQPWVYYHPYSDVNNYDQHWVENNPNQDGMKNDPNSDGSSSPSSHSSYTPMSNLGSVGGSTAKPTTPATTPATSASTSAVPAPVVPLAPKKGGLTITQSENRLQIPIKAVRIAGFTTHQKVYVHVTSSNSEIHLIGYAVASPNGSLKVRGSTVVNKDGRIRLCKKFLKKVYNLSGAFATQYNVNPSGGEIVVRPL